jgi:multisubunit Na+/H+ antiporter MnhC subunit
MSLHVLDLICWILGIRGHIPQHNDFGAGRSESSFTASPLMRVLAAIVVTVALLSLALWAAVWLTIKLL